MNYSKIYYVDVINGNGLRASLFVSGCTIHCKGCFNKETWNFNNGNLFTELEEDKIIETIFNDKGIEYSGLSILGGEPLDNIDGLISLVSKFKKYNINNSKDIWLWTGYTLEQILKDEKKKQFLYNYINTVIVGPFDENLKDLTLKYRGSKNQNIYDIKFNEFYNKINY